MKMRLIRIFVFLLIGMGIGLAIAYKQKDVALEGSETELPENASILKAPVSKPDETSDIKSDIGGPFTLVDQNGNTVTQDNYKDSYKLVFFGFTYCPAICPTELQKIQKVMDGLGDKASKIQPIFITVDPERDTPERLKEYVSKFHAKQVGLTGSNEQIEAVKQSFRVYANKIEMGSPENYMMDHSAFTFLMSPDNKLISMYSTKDTAEHIIADIQAKNF